jgi:inosine-uridine preferring nucleoside hydrolase
MKTWPLIFILLAGIAGVVKTAPAFPRQPVVLSTDCGTEMDDQWALALMALSPAVELRGVMGAHAPNLAPPAAETAARTARDVLAHLNLKHAPRVVAGSSRPLTDATTPIESEGTKLLLREARSFSPQRRLAVLVIGSATDIASALLLDPTLADRIEVIAVAFDRWPQGGDPWNVRNGVRAWQIHVASRVPLAIGPTETCVRPLVLARTAARDMLSSAGEPRASR